jgi:hypothetical protein
LCLLLADERHFCEYSAQRVIVSQVRYLRGVSELAAILGGDDQFAPATDCATIPSGGATSGCP